MADRQLFAKIAVLILLGVNVAAYYILWPRHNGAPMGQTKAPDRDDGTAQILPSRRDGRPIVTKPKDFLATAQRDAAPRIVPGLPAKNDQETAATDAASRLLDHINRETGATNAAPIPPPIIVPARFDQKKDDAPNGTALVIPSPNPRTLPALKAAPLIDPATSKSDPDVAVTSALTPKGPHSPWLLSTKKSGSQTLLSAKLRRRPASAQAVELEILCDRVQSIGDGGVQALGNVTFAGSGLRGSCQRLTVPGNRLDVVFEEQVRIVPDVGGWSSSNGQMQGERIVWELATTDADGISTEFRPAEVFLPKARPQAVLGAPK